MPPPPRAKRSQAGDLLQRPINKKTKIFSPNKQLYFFAKCAAPSPARGAPAHSPQTLRRSAGRGGRAAGSGWAPGALPASARPHRGGRRPSPRGGGSLGVPGAGPAGETRSSRGGGGGGDGGGGGGAGRASGREGAGRGGEGVGRDPAAAAGRGAARGARGWGRRGWSGEGAGGGVLCDCEQKPAAAVSAGRAGGGGGARRARGDRGRGRLGARGAGGRALRPGVE